MFHASALFKHRHMYLDKEIKIQDILIESGNRENSSEDLINRLLLASSESLDIKFLSLILVQMRYYASSRNSILQSK